MSKILRKASRRYKGWRYWQLRPGVELIARADMWRAVTIHWYIKIDKMPLVTITDRNDIQGLLACALGCPSCGDVPRVETDYGTSSVVCENCYDADCEGENWAHGRGNNPLEAYDDLCERHEERGR